MPRTLSPDPIMAALPVLFGHTDDFARLVARLREYVRLRETPLGPWVFDAAEHGCDVWEWVARNGCGDSCRDSRILDEFAEIVLAHDPLSGLTAVVPWRPAPRSVLMTESFAVNQALSFVALHLDDPQQVAYTRLPADEGEAACPDGMHPDFLYGGHTASGLGASADVQGLLFYFDLDESDDPDEMSFEIGEYPATSVVPDWAELVLRDHRAYFGRGRWAPPRTADELYRRLDATYDDWLGTGTWLRGSEYTPAFTLGFEAMMARVIRRTNEMRRLYSTLWYRWPELPELRLTNPTAHVTLCLGSPGTVQIAAEAACADCEGCDWPGDLIPGEQLRLAV